MCSGIFLIQITTDDMHLRASHMRRSESATGDSAGYVHSFCMREERPQTFSGTYTQGLLKS